MSHLDTRRCIANTVEKLGVALRELGESRDLFRPDDECDSSCDHQAPDGLTDDLADAERAAVGALATCTAALHAMLADSST